MIAIPLAILALVTSAGVAQVSRSKKKDDPKLQVERQVIYETAINTVKDPVKLRKLSKAFRDEGLTAEADMLEKRAALQELPDEVKAGRRDVFRKAMTNTDPAKVLAVAEVFHNEGCTGAAENLRRYAAGLAKAEVKEGET